MVMLLSSYNHEALSGESFDSDSHHHLHHGLTPDMLHQQTTSNCGMQELIKPTSSSDVAIPGGNGNNGNGNGGNSNNGSNSGNSNPARALRIKPQPNQVLKCPRCNSLNTKFCYYNNYSLTQPRHFCKNCRRYWTKGGALRNVPVGGGCRKNKRAKQKNNSSDHSASEKTGSGSFSGSDRSQLGCSSSSLYDLGKEDDVGGMGLSYNRLAHTMRLDHSGTSSGLSFEIPRGSGAPFSGSLPISLPGFDVGLSTAATLTFQGLMKQENGGEFAGNMYDPSLNLLGGPASVAPMSSDGFNLGLESFVGLGLNGDLKWRQQQKIATLLDSEQETGGGGIHPHHHHHHHGFHHLEDAESLSRNKGKSSMEQQVSEQQTPSDHHHWQGQNQESFMDHHQQQQQQQQQPVVTNGETTYWNNGTGWPLVDLPMYVDQQYCDVKAVEQTVPEFYPRMNNRIAPSMT